MKIVDRKTFMRMPKGTVFCKFHRETVHRAFVDTCDESFHHLLGHKFHVVELGYFRQIDCICHRQNFRAQRYNFFRLSKNITDQN